MAISTLDRLLRIQSTEPTSIRPPAKMANTQIGDLPNGDAGVPPAPPPVPRASSNKGRGASPYRNQFRVAFDFLQRYTDNPPQTPEAWDVVARDLIQSANDGGNDALLMDLLCAAYEQIERVYKAARP